MNKTGKFNILILSAGRRVELINLFKKTSKDMNLNAKIVAADYSNLAPALYFADDKVLLPKISSKNYINEIIKNANYHNISLIIPTIDTDLLLLAKNKQKIEEETRAKVLISDYKIVDICRDKFKTQTFFEENNFGVPKLYNFKEINENSSFPLFLKPKDGSSSQNIFKVNNYNEFITYSKIIGDPVIQEFIEGDEYTIDAFLDFNSNIITIVPRLRIQTRGGEISKGKIVKDREIINEIKAVLETLKPIGHITLQLMKTKNGIKFIEINPRFGGGAPMSIMSGANSCENLFRILNNEKLEYNENYQENEVYLRFDSSIKISDKK